ncbi:hypothetical protein ABH930_000383 [Kitasatospora sp. GAS204A]|nr:hypothetical protein [Kitasatospora sp. GAS204B]
MRQVGSVIWEMRAPKRLETQADAPVCTTNSCAFMADRLFDLAIHYPL